MGVQYTAPIRIIHGATVSICVTDALTFKNALSWVRVQKILNSILTSQGFFVAVTNILQTKGVMSSIDGVPEHTTYSITPSTHRIFIEISKQQVKTNKVKQNANTFWFEFRFTFFDTLHPHIFRYDNYRKSRNGAFFVNTESESFV